MSFFRNAACLAILLPMLAACADPRAGKADGGRLSVRLADAMLRAGDPAAALQVADGMLASDPQDAEAHARHGRALMSLGRPAEAAQDLAETARARPADMAILAALAAAREAAGDATAAEAAWRGVLARQPADWHAHAGLAIALDLQGRHGEAQVLYRETLRQRPDDVAAETNLGLSLALSGSAREAIEFLQRPGISAQSARARHDLAVALVLSGDETGARAVLIQDMSTEETNAAVDGVRSLSRS